MSITLHNWVLLLKSLFSYVALECKQKNQEVFTRQDKEYADLFN